MRSRSGSAGYFHNYYERSSIRPERKTGYCKWSAEIGHRHFMRNTEVEQAIKMRYEVVATHLDERARRLMLAAEARAIGRGGVATVVHATGVSHHTVDRGLKELDGIESVPDGRIRLAGGGRKKAAEQPGLLAALNSLIEPTTRGDPESPLRWTCKSTRVLAAELQQQGFRISHETVSELLIESGYSLQANRKVLEGGDHPDRNAQFEHIQKEVNNFHEIGEPVVSVDAKKKELIGNYKNNGQEWHPEGEAPQVKVYDFIGQEGKVTPYGIYDLQRNEAWVNVGTDHDTSEFAVSSLRGWWETMGRAAYPNASRLLITADGGGSNGYRTRLWKMQLQHFADATGLAVQVCHFPPGTSKWNKIEHRLFNRISQNWRGRPLVNHEVVVSLIAATTSTTGLQVQARLDTTAYPVGVKVPDADMALLSLERDPFHGEWNYRINPRPA